MINLAPWHDVLIASSAAAATLAGLILTAMAVNIDAILKYPSLPPRAGSAIGSLVYVLVLNVAALIPGATPTILGWVTLVVLLAPLAIQVDVMVRQLQIRPRQSFGRLWSKVALGLGQVVPFIVSGALLLAGSSLGLTWMLIGSMAVFVVLGRQRVGAARRDPPLTRLGRRGHRGSWHQKYLSTVLDILVSIRTGVLNSTHVFDRRASD